MLLSLGLRSTKRPDTHIQKHTYHTADIGDGCVFVRVGIQQHLCVGMKGQVGSNVLSVFPKEVCDSLHLWLRFWERTTVSIVTGVCRGSFICRSEKKMGGWGGVQEGKKPETQTSIVKLGLFIFLKIGDVIEYVIQFLITGIDNVHFELFKPMHCRRA